MLAASSRPLTIVAAALIGLSSLALPSLVPARAQSASAWQKDAHAAARLLAGAMVKTAGASFLRAGIEIRLESGWKTYWRYPGDTGTPPEFNFIGSENVKLASVLWPAPERFDDGAGGHSIGYMGDIILPLQVVPVDATRPASLHVKLNYAICGTLCVPADATLQMTLIGNGTDEATLQKAALKVPKRVALGASSGSALAIQSVWREPGGAHERVVVELAAAAGATVDLFAEGPTPDWALPLPEPDGAASGTTRRFTFDLDGLPAGAQAKGATLTLTAVSGDDAIEVPAHLD